LFLLETELGIVTPGDVVTALSPAFGSLSSAPIHRCIGPKSNTQAATLPL
jgi:hypothetical protein